MLEVKELYVGYGQSEVIHSASFEAKQGEILAIMGRNGMGKTTLLKSLLGMDQASPQRCFDTNSKCASPSATIIAVAKIPAARQPPRGLQG